MKTICDICLRELKGEKHNPSPIEASVCCDECNTNVVIPYRIYLSNENKDKALLFLTNNTLKLVRPKNKHFELEELQNYVEGLIELYPHRVNGDIVICNEEGLLLDMEYNHLVKLILGLDLVGPVLLSPTNLDEYDEDE
ncbi:MAG: DUF3846 domain-containing protein [Acholeplasmataceae bacterium]|nr:DUF3846 domain-containing protein [Acholeplasmataceae bacterium]